MAGGEEIDEKVAEALLKRLESESNGAKLSVFMVDALMALIGPTVASVEEVAGLTNKDIEEEFEEAYEAARGKKPIAIERRRMARWAATTTRSTLSHKSSSTSSQCCLLLY